MSPINYDFPTVIHKIAKTWFRDKVAIFQDFAWFCLLGPRLSSLDTPPFLKLSLTFLRTAILNDVTWLHSWQIERMNK